MIKLHDKAFYEETGYYEVKATWPEKNWYGHAFIGKSPEEIAARLTNAITEQNIKDWEENEKERRQMKETLSSLSLWERIE